jgi:hypothetical protein
VKQSVFLVFDFCLSIFISIDLSGNSADNDHRGTELSWSALVARIDSVAVSWLKGSELKKKKKKVSKIIKSD